MTVLGQSALRKSETRRMSSAFRVLRELRASIILSRPTKLSKTSNPKLIVDKTHLGLLIQISFREPILTENQRFEIAEKTLNS